MHLTGLKLAIPAIKAKFQTLLEGKSIEVPISETIRYEYVKNDEVSIFTLLLFTGYLIALSVKQEKLSYLCEVVIPNQEVQLQYEHSLLEWLEQAYE